MNAPERQEVLKFLKGIRAESGFGVPGEVWQTIYEEAVALIERLEGQPAPARWTRPVANGVPGIQEQAALLTAQGCTAIFQCVTPACRLHGQRVTVPLNDAEPICPECRVVMGFVRASR